jgi:hypothetical protein
VGAGSVLFHMTLWRIGQVMDELPMVWGNSAFVYVCLSMHDLPGTSRPGSVAVLALITAAITVIYVSNPDAHGPFLLVYGSGLLTIVILSWRMASAKSWNGPPLMEVRSVANPPRPTGSAVHTGSVDRSDPCFERGTRSLHSLLQSCLPNFLAVGLWRQTIGRRLSVRVVHCAGGAVQLFLRLVAVGDRADDVQHRAAVSAARGVAVRPPPLSTPQRYGCGWR